MSNMDSYMVQVVEHHIFPRAEQMGEIMESPEKQNKVISEAEQMVEGGNTVTSFRGLPLEKGPSKGQ
jgi:hypothetical protein